MNLVSVNISMGGKYLKSYVTERLADIQHYDFRGVLGGK